MFNNPPNENHTAPGSNKILITFLSPSIKQCGQWANSANNFLERLKRLSPGSRGGGNEVNLFLGRTIKIKKKSHVHTELITPKAGGWKPLQSAGHVEAAMGATLYCTILLLQPHEDQKDWKETRGRTEHSCSRKFKDGHI